jgi:crotonobetainyl-CoA:carnitine CoA-transferase CaiB-like acyl-CoA transferase
MSKQPLQDIQIVSLALNVPGPVAAARLHALGASVTKIEPPAGDPLERWSPSWYTALSAGQQIMHLDLKLPETREQLDWLLSEADLLLTSMRPSALQRLALTWEQLSACYPRLCMVAILGYPAPEQERAGHDLTYQAWLGLVDPGHMPRTLIADLAGAEQAINAALALLLGRERGLGSGYMEVFLAQAAESFAQPLRQGATTASGPFGGGLPRYGLYQAQEGWVALAALEEHFWQRLKDELGLEEDEVQTDILQRIFLERTAVEWEAWGLERDVPILAVRD